MPSRSTAAAACTCAASTRARAVHKHALLHAVRRSLLLLHAWGLAGWILDLAGSGSAPAAAHLRLWQLQPQQEGELCVVVIRKPAPCREPEVHF